MKLIASGRRGNIYLVQKDNLKYIRKQAKSQDKKGSILKEIQILKYLNKISFEYVPTFLGSGEGWFEQKYIDGEPFHKIFKKGNLHIKKKLLLSLLDIAYKLDLKGVYHGELSRPTKNLIIDKNGRLRIIDFERGKLGNYNGKNLKDVTQFFVSLGILTKQQAMRLGNMRNLEEIYMLLKRYILYYPFSYLSDGLVLFIGLLILDFFTKFTFYTVLNRGSSFGLKWFSNQLLIVLGLLSIFLIIYLIFKKKLYIIPAVFLLAGIVGNTVDRIFFEGVRDWINWGLFTNNLADIWITIGVVGILYCYFATNDQKNIYRRYSWLCGGA